VEGKAGEQEIRLRGEEPAEIMGFHVSDQASDSPQTFQHVHGAAVSGRSGLRHWKAR
jgi:hypothetical protein